jgi:hypothetical protein
MSFEAYYCTEPSTVIGEEWSMDEIMLTGKNRRDRTRTCIKATVKTRYMDCVSGRYGK